MLLGSHLNTQTLVFKKNIEDVVKESTQIWKLIYGLTIVNKGKAEPLEVKDDEEDDEKDKTIEAGTKMDTDDKASTEPV